MVALLDKSEGKAVQDILQAIAETYPQVPSLIYSLVMQVARKIKYLKLF